MTTTATTDACIIIHRPKCPKCGNRVKGGNHKGNVRYLECACGHKFKGLLR